MGKYLEIDEAVRLIREGQCVAVPTETVYGLACNALDPSALSHLYSIKGRPQNNPVICHVSSPEMAFRFGKENELARRLMETYWPGPLTILLENLGEIPETVTAGSSLCGFRMPDHELTLKIIEMCDVPLAMPSANKSGKTSPVTPAMVLTQLEGEIPGVVDGGQCSVGLESTVVRLQEDEIVILRPGQIDASRLTGDGFRLRRPDQEMERESADQKRASKAERNSQANGEDGGVAVATAEPEPLASPGLLPVHYQPEVDLFLIEMPVDDSLNPGFPQAAYETIAVLNLHSDPIKLQHLLPRRLCEKAVLRNRSNSGEAARQLYLDLFELGRNSDALIVVAGDSATEAMMDRLRRAASALYREGSWTFRKQQTEA